uniref:Reverse transcriptase domain-containing protein n=1 Tax=Tanacetum cinerariifolium TaxID=118510 RepID=A0A6L2P0Z5_TANCI|nr:reverse transcriptase domain-containing protein [Tanacetum cinerariifolium]
MSAMANTTPLVTTVTKPATNPRDADATPRVNIQEFCKEYYEDILPIIMDKVRRDRRKDVHTRLDFREGHRRQSAFDRLSGTYLPSATKSRLRGTDSRDRPRGRSRTHRLDTSNEDCPNDKERFRSVGESYDDSFSHSYRDGNHSRHMKRRRDNESPLSSVSKNDSSDVSYKDLKAAFLAYFMQQKIYVKDPVEIHNIKQKDEETIEDFMERFKVETGRMKGAPECMRISGFMHGVNNPELTKRLNEHVPKTMEEMMITTTAFIRGEAAAASKKNGHTLWKAQTSPKGKLQKKGPTSGVTQREEGDLTGNSTDECMQLKKQIEELVRVGKLSHMIKEIKHERVQSKMGKKETPAKDKPTAIYMIQSWQRMTRQKVTQSFERVKEITFPPLTAIALHPDFPDQEVAIGGTLSEKGHTELCSILKKNLDIFAWQPSDLTGVPRSAAEHRLNIQEGYSADCYSLPEIDWKVESLCGYHFKCFLDAYKGYHQIQLVEPDEEKTAFHTGQGVVEEGVFLGYVVTPDGIKLCPDKTAAVLQLPSPRTIKEVQSLNGKLASLNRFLSKSAEKSLPLFKTLKKCIKKSDFQWTVEAEQAFKQLKQHLSELPILVAPKPKEGLIIFLSGQELNYTPMEKLVLSLIFAAKRLRRTTANIEYHARRTQYHVQAKNVGQRTDPSGFSYRNVRRKPTSRASGINSTRAADTLHGRLIMSSNNEAEYEALIAGLRITTLMGVQNVYVSVDSKLVANQVLGTYVAKEENMVKYLDKVKSLVLVEVLKDKSIKEKDVTTVVEEDGPTWMTPIVEYLKEGTLPGDRKEARKHRINELMEGILYRRSFLTPWLRCVGPLQAKYVIREIHEGSCSMHAGPRSVVAKAIRLGYYWPVMHRDARDMIRKCNNSGPFPEGPGKVKFLIVAMNYFTKWIEEKAVATITGGQVKKFVWDNIVCRFGLPGEIVSDNGKQFSDNPFKDWCDKLNITQRFASVKHPQSNGLVERANRSLGEGIKARLGEGNKNWVEELPHVLWAHRTMIKSSHGDTPFSLTYETEAVIPAEIGMSTYRTATVDVVSNDKELRLNSDLLKERCERAAICEAKAKLKMTKYYNARVRGVTFRPGDFVYRNNDASHAVAGGKLGPK